MMKRPVEEQFFIPRKSINIVALPNSANEAHAIRAVLEAFACAVSIHWIGTPGDFLAVLGQGDTAPQYLIISGHGDDENGYYLGEYADFIDTSMLQGQYLPPQVLENAINLPNCTVISTACAGGTQAMGQAFSKNSKIAAYIACRDYPDYGDMLVYLVNFFHNILRKKLSNYQAWHRAMTMTDAPEIYHMSFFHPDGTEEQYQSL